MMTKMTKEQAIRQLHEVYVMGCFDPYDFADTPVEIWKELLPEAEEVYTEKGIEFTLTEDDIPAIKEAVEKWLKETV